MRLLGFEITRAKSLTPVAENRGGWFSIVKESFAGAWQENVVVDHNLVLSYHAVYACITLIASDIAKLHLKLVQKNGDGIWQEVANAAYDPVIRRPNRYQNRIQFWESWMLSKLTRGNTYVLKVRDARGVVSGLYVLDPSRVKPLVGDDGSVFYDLHADNLSGLESQIIVPAREIIHDRMNCLFHPLVGTSPIFASGLAGMQGLKIQEHSAWFFSNNANPGGVLTAPGSIAKATADRIKEHWDANYSGKNSGKVAVLGDGLKYEQMAVNAIDAQLVEQLKWSAEVVCSTFHVPPYMIGIGPMPTYNNIQALNQQYYSQALQSLIEAAELCMDEGLEMRPGIGVEFDLDDLLRMDTLTKVQAARDAIGAGFLAPNEARAKFDLAPVEGGDTPYLQQQNYSLSALAERDKLGPLVDPGPNPGGVARPSTDDDETEGEGDADEELDRAAVAEQIRQASRRHARAAA